MKRPAALLLSLCAAAAAAAAPDFVTILGGELRAGEKPAAFVCAAGAVEPVGPASVGAGTPRTAAAPAAARRLALAGFDMVRLSDLEVPRPGDAASEARLAVQDSFVAACKAEGIRVWAEVLHPVSDFVPTPADVAALDDPATAEAWTNAVAEAAAAGADLSLAAAWDPRLEVLLQRRLRDWARAFNPETGLRRCDDPTYALFSFSSLWWEDMDDPARPPLPAFFEEELRTAWNDYLYERFGSDASVGLRFALAPGESVEEGTVALRAPEGTPDASRERERRTFLHGLHVAHLRRLLAPFPSFGQTARTAPRLVRHGGAHPVLADLSTIGLAPAEPGAAPRPWVSDRPAATDARDPLLGAAQDFAAGASIVVLDGAGDPDAHAVAAVAAVAAHASPETFLAVARAAHRHRSAAFDAPGAAHATLVVPARAAAEPSVAVFPAAGLAAAVVRVAPGAAPAFPADLETNALPRHLLVCLPDAPSAPAPTAFSLTFLHAPGGAWEALRLERTGGAAPAEPATLLLRGPGFAKKRCVPVAEDGSEGPALEPAEGLLRLDLSDAPRARLLFLPPSPGAALLRAM